MKYHGGFKTGNTVEVLLGKPLEWKKDFIIVDFHLMNVVVIHKHSDLTYRVSVFHIRKPNIKVGR